MQVTPSGQGLGARVEGCDISQPLSQENYKKIEGPPRDLQAGPVNRVQLPAMESK